MTFEAIYEFLKRITEVFIVLGGSLGVIYKVLIFVEKKREKRMEQFLEQRIEKESTINEKKIAIFSKDQHSFQTKLMSMFESVQFDILNRLKEIAKPLKETLDTHNDRIRDLEIAERDDHAKITLIIERVDNIDERMDILQCDLKELKRDSN